MAGTTYEPYSQRYYRALGGVNGAGRRGDRTIIVTIIFTATEHNTPSETKGVCEGCDLIVKLRRFQWQEEEKANESTGGCGGCGGGIVVFVGGNVHGGSATCRATEWNTRKSEG